MNQKTVEFDIFELNYGNESTSVVKNANDKQHYFFVKDFETHTEAMIFLLNQAFDTGYEIVYNTNLDDFYDEFRFYYQYVDLIENKNVLNSCLFTTIKDDVPDNSFVYTNHKFTWTRFDNNRLYHEKIPYEHIKQDLKKNHNVICHPGVCFTREFWNSYDRYGNLLRYRSDKPFEDLSLWRRAVDNNIRIGVVNKNLVWYRVHKNSVTSTASRLSRNHSLYKCFKDFSKEPDYGEFNLGFFIPLENNRFQILADIENNIQPYKKKFYFLRIGEEYANELCDFLIKHNINKHVCISDNIDFNIVREQYTSSIEMNTDYFYNLNQISFDYVFYTCIYCIPKSKFDFQQYVEWGRYLFHFLKDYILVIFTDKTTLDRLQPEFNFDTYTNIRIVIKELCDMEYQCDDVFQKNTDKKYFPNHDIDYHLIKIWINRHLLIKDVQKVVYSDYYCHIDFGYVRNKSTIRHKFDSNMLNQDKIYLGLINNNKHYIDYLKGEIKDYDKIKIENTLIRQSYSIGGGFSIIPFSKIYYWTTVFRSTFNTFLEKNIDFKDDQTILRQIAFDQDNDKNFQLINVHNDWFPFLKFFDNNKSVHIL